MKKDELKSLTQIPIPVGQPAKPLTDRERIKIFEQRRTGRVVDDPRMQIEWKPIDKVAARVVAEAPWWADPPRPPPKFMNKETKEEFASKQVPRVRTKVMLNEEGYREELIDLESTCAPALEADTRIVKKDLSVNEELVQRSREVVAAIHYLTTEVNGPWAEHREFVKKAIAEAREARIALGSETRLLLAAMRDVRTFFLENDYHTQVDRLREFIDLCERLKALKEAGVLDAVADTILKL